MKNTHAVKIALKRYCKLWSKRDKLTKNIIDNYYVGG